MLRTLNQAEVYFKAGNEYLAAKLLMQIGDHMAKRLVIEYCLERRLLQYLKRTEHSARWNIFNLVADNNGYVFEWGYSSTPNTWNQEQELFYQLRDIEQALSASKKFSSYQIREALKYTRKYMLEVFLAFLCPDAHTLGRVMENKTESFYHKKIRIRSEHSGRYLWVNEDEPKQRLYCGTKIPDTWETFRTSHAPDGWLTLYGNNQNPLYRTDFNSGYYIQADGSEPALSFRIYQLEDVYYIRCYNKNTRRNWLTCRFDLENNRGFSPVQAYGLNADAWETFLIDII